MIHRGAQAVVTEAAGRARRAHTDLLRQMSTSAEELAQRNEAGRKQQRRRSVVLQRQLRIRVQSALQAVNALCDIGVSAEFQSLVAHRSIPVVLWGGTSGPRSPGGDMADVCWEYIGFIQLTATSIRIEYCTKTNGKIEWLPGGYFFATIPYAVEDTLLRSRPLWKIATSSPIDLADLQNMEVYSPEAIFQILVECANPARLESIIRSQIK